ncbi:Aminoacyl-tRNA editing domain protein [Candidatus Anstonella stagnisolia]|nr:Aminoacyl-tRNA editing domain protein [Candidatus Anstonella stagnisolia]
MQENFEEKLKAYMQGHGIAAQHMHFSQSCHSVKEAAAAAHASEGDFVKNVCMLDAAGSIIVCIVKGEDKASGEKIAALLKIPKPRLATSQEMLEKTGYPAGGTPSFGYRATFLVDLRVMEKQYMLTGGGSGHSLVKISPKELLRANNAKTADIRAD